MKKYKEYEDIYPLTIIQMRYGGKYVAFNLESDLPIINDVQLLEEAMYDTEKYLEDNGVYKDNFGIGNTIWGALDNLIKNHNEFEDSLKRNSEWK